MVIKTGNKQRFYARRGLVMRPVFMLPAEAEAIRQRAFAAHISQQQWMREVLSGLRTVGPVRTGAYTASYEPGPPVDPGSPMLGGPAEYGRY